MDKLFSVIVVSLNPGKRLAETLNSIKDQNFKEFEVIIKDGGSTDGSLDAISSFEDMDIKLITGADKGIYDAMNTALSNASGRYICFLNCGDSFYDPGVLQRTSGAVKEYESSGRDDPAIFYGDVYEMVTGSTVTSNPSIDAFACYRNVPCHQACFYDRRLVTEHPFDTKYKVRADYEQFLWCFFKAKAAAIHMGFTVAKYEGNGYSESRTGRKISKEEHRLITAQYMTPGQIAGFRLILLVTLSPLRSAISRSRYLAGPYNSLKKLVYRKDRRND